MLANDRFERELERLRKEMELASATGSSSSTTSGRSPSNAGTPYLPAGESSGSMGGLDASPLVLPSTGQGEEMPDMDLEDAVGKLERNEPHRGKTT